MKKIALIVLCFGISACAPPTETTIKLDDVFASGIIKGKPVLERKTAAEKSVVMMGFIEKTGKRTGACSATLIGPNTVLTAAHCFFTPLGVPKTISAEILFANNRHTEKNFPVRVVRGWTIHKRYNDTPLPHVKWEKNEKGKWIKVPDFVPGKFHNHDIAVAVFEGQIPEGYAYVAIDRDTEANYSGRKLKALGYGRGTDYDKKEHPTNTPAGILRQGTTIVDEDFDLSKEHFYLRLRSPNSICHGDSGGPQFLVTDGETKVIGVNSTAGNEIVLKDGRTACRSRGKAIRVAPFAGWIASESARLLKKYKLEK